MFAFFNESLLLSRNSSIFFVIIKLSLIWTNSPPLPSRRISLGPELHFVEIIGISFCAASTKTLGKPSYNELNINKSAS